MSFEEWKHTTIGSICEIRRGASPRPIQEYLSTEGMPWVKIADATRDSSRYVNETRECIIDSGIKNSVVVDPGDLILSNSATPGLPKILNIRACIHDGWLLLSNLDGVTKPFLYYLLTNERRLLVYSSNGSVFNNLKTDIVRNHPINLPSIPEQLAISRILSALDDKIELKNRMNKTLENITQTIFKRWFVDFEFPDKKGNPYKSSGGAMIESSLGMIPDGWVVKSIDQIASLKNGVNYGREQRGKHFRILNVRDFIGGQVLDTSSLDMISYEIDKSRSYLLNENDTVIVRSAKPGETVLIKSIDEPVLYSGFCIRIRANIDFLSLYIFGYTRKSMAELENSSNGTIFKNLNQDILGGLMVSIPPESIALSYNCIVDPIYNLQLANLHSSRALSDVRDTLLPKLMSGEIRVPLTEA